MKPGGYQSAPSNLSNVADSHQATRTHIANHTAYNLLGNVDVACALDEARKREIAKHNHNASRYTRMVEHHIDAAVFLTAQGLAFRGHDESKSSSNRGNFLELMDLLGEYSSELRSFLDKETITYTSHDPQNDLIECVYEEVKTEIQKRIDNSNFIAVMMDDTSDCSNIEQSAVSVRLINNGEIEEHLLGMINSSDDQSADALTNILMDTLKKYKITPEKSKEKLIGQSYDGAPSMSGELSGVQKQIQDQFPAAYYNHCVAHRMSLCASQTAKKIPRVAAFFDIVDKVIRFFRSSPKRSHLLGRSIPKPGDTRWLSHDIALGVIDTWYEEIGSVLYEMACDVTEKAEIRATARGLCLQIQRVEFVFLLKLYRKIFDFCAPVIKTMQKPTIDAVQLSSMLDDFKNSLQQLDYNQMLEDTMKIDPEMPSIRRREGWRGIENSIDGSPNSWKRSLEAIGKEVTTKFLEQLLWRFENLKKFRWMELIHPTIFEERRKTSPDNMRELINELRATYPFAVSDQGSLEHCLDVLYSNKEIALLLQKLFKERDALVMKTVNRRRRLARKQSGEPQDPDQDERPNVEEEDRFEIASDDVDVESIKEGKPTVQDLLTVIQKAGLQEALSQAMTLIELAAVTPLTSVHCERTFSRMKRVVSPSRATMLQARKEMLVTL